MGKVCGILRSFTLRLLGGQPPVIYEDGGQLRDYVYVGDVAQATATPIEVDENGRLDQWPEGFFDQWDKATSALLFPEPQVA